MVSATAAKLSFAGATTFLVLLALLHFIKPEFDPSWRMISEYEIGRYSWIMQIAFLALAVSFATLFVALLSQVRTLVGRIGLAFLLLSAAGTAIAAYAVSDPITTPPDQMSAQGNLHVLGFQLGVPSLPIAAALISLGLRRNQAWASARRALMWSAGLTWLTVLVMVGTVMVLLPQNGGKFGPSVVIGWPNRLLIVAYCAWVMTAAWHVIKLRGGGPEKIEDVE